MLRSRINKSNNRKGLSSGKPPLASLLTFFSKQRDDTTVINKLDSSGNSDAYLTVDPAVDIIDLSKYDIEDGTGGDLGWKVVKFNTINGEKTYRVISTPTTYIENGSTYNGLNEVRNDIFGKYILKQDIDLNVPPYNDGLGWIYINSFSGIINGNGFAINNLYCNNPDDSVGFIGLNGTSSVVTKISNLMFGNINLTGKDRVGVICGYCSYFDLKNIGATGNANGNSFVGGLCGYSLSNGYFTNCYFIGNVNSTVSTYAGGLIGAINNVSSVKYCYSNTNLNSVVGRVFLGTTFIESYYDGQNNVDLTSSTFFSDKDWDFDNIWGLDGSINDGYPYLRNLNGEYVSPYGTLTKIVTVNITETDANDPHSYIKMPDSIKIGGLSLFNKADPVIYDTTVSTTAEEYVSEDPYLWHVDELNTERILSYLKDAYKFTWFVKSTFTEGTYEPLTIKEIFAYSQKIADSDDLNKIKAYIGYNWS